MLSDEERKARNRASTARYRERQKAKGVAPPKRNDEQKAQQREAMRQKRAAARSAGLPVPGADWAKKNPDRHRENGARWRAANPERHAEITRRNQAARRSTPWGRINNCMWPILHNGVRVGATRQGKYCTPLGYVWLDLRNHLEAQFTDEMTWENWGTVWELDHIVPLSSFKYESLDDPLFREAWALSNLRPLPIEENQRKRNKPG